MLGIPGHTFTVGDIHIVKFRCAHCSVTISPDGVLTFGLPDHALITNYLVSTKHVAVLCAVP